MNGYTKCRIGCGACCIFIDISSAIPNHPLGKPAGTRCKNMDLSNACNLHGTDKYPKVCDGYKAEKDFCGDNFNEAKEILINLV
jgi:hypothetical protein